MINDALRVPFSLFIVRFNHLCSLLVTFSQQCYPHWGKPVSAGSRDGGVTGGFLCVVLGLPSLFYPVSSWRCWQCRPSSIQGPFPRDHKEEDQAPENCQRNCRCPKGLDVDPAINIGRQVVGRWPERCRWFLGLSLSPVVVSFISFISYNEPKDFFDGFLDGLLLVRTKVSYEQRCSRGGQTCDQKDVQFIQSTPPDWCWRSFGTEARVKVAAEQFHTGWLFLLVILLVLVLVLSFCIGVSLCLGIHSPSFPWSS